MSLQPSFSHWPLRVFRMTLQPCRACWWQAELGSFIRWEQVEHTRHIITSEKEMWRWQKWLTGWNSMVGICNLFYSLWSWSNKELVLNKHFKCSTPDHRTGPKVQNCIYVFLVCSCPSHTFGTSLGLWCYFSPGWQVQKNLRKPCNSVTFLLLSNDRHHFGNLVPKFQKNSNATKRNNLSVQSDYGDVCWGKKLHKNRWAGKHSHHYRDF